MSSPSSGAPTAEPTLTTDLPPLEITTQTEDFALLAPSPVPLRVPTLRTATDPPLNTSMTTSSTPLGSINAARRPIAPQPTLSSIRSNGLPQDMQAKMKAFHLSRQGTPPGQKPSPVPSGAVGRGLPVGGQVTSGGFGGPLLGNPGGLRLPQASRPQITNINSAPAIPNARMNPAMGLAAKRGLKAGMKLADAMGPSPASNSPTGVSPGALTLNGESTRQEVPKKPENQFSKFTQYVDTEKSTLKFAGKATIHPQGIDFSSGSSFSMSLDEVDTLEELGKGNYGTVYQVRHSRPQMRRPGLGLEGNKAPTLLNKSTSALASSTVSTLPESPHRITLSPTSPSNQNHNQNSTSGLIMAMKEIRLELDEAKFAAIIMELDILHRCTSPFIIDFYGAFFQEGAVYICMEFMDGGSIDKLYGDGIPESVLRKIALSTVMGLKTLKDEHNIIHRDVKPTNILVNSRGQVKICDFGVSGNLVASIAKTNIGCQSYMAPERIAGGGVAQAGANPGGGTYSVQSDVWSLGLSVIECAMGRYPYPPETYNNIFSQLSAIVDGDPPDLPDTGFSDPARDFVRGCLHKIPKMRPTYAMMLKHPWLAPLLKPPTISEEDEEDPTPTEGDVGTRARVALGLESDTTANGVAVNGPLSTADAEVAAWVISAMERRRSGKMGKSATPALHAAPLDTIPSPKKEVAAGGDR